MKRIVIAGAVIAAGFVLIAAYVLGQPAAPAATPPGATPLLLRRLAPQWSFPGLPRGCPLAASVPVRVVATDDALSFEVAASGEPTQLVFPYGYAAWRVDGVAQLVSPSGAVLAQEGDVVDGLMGSAADNGDFVLCFDPATKLVVTPGS